MDIPISSSRPVASMAADPREAAPIPRRPAGPPVMYQRWQDLLFLHWPMPAAELERFVPPGLTLDTFDGMGWISITPLSITGLRPAGLPAMPVISRTLEVNVRTYARYRGERGIVFLSLDATNPLAVAGARALFGLPYRLAAMLQRQEGERFTLYARRLQPPLGGCTLRWRRGRALPPATPDSLDAFLAERYCLYTVHGGRLCRARIHHQHPWPLCQAVVEELRATLIESHGLPSPKGPPLVRAQGAPLEVATWPLRPVDEPDDTPDALSR